jgi:iron-binding zinc finger CDGSH type
MKILKYIRHFSQSPVKPSRVYYSTDTHTLEDFEQLTEQKKQHWEYHQKETGKVYSVKPIKVKCKEGNMYLWCSCGHSKSQVT